MLLVMTIKTKFSGTGVGTDNYLSITGGNEKQYLASVSYMKNQGIIKGADFQRYGLKVRVDQHLNNWAKVSAGLNYINTFSNEKPNGNVFYSPINSETSPTIFMILPNVMKRETFWQ
jgi:hypothetical protein